MYSTFIRKKKIRKKLKFQISHNCMNRRRECNVLRSRILLVNIRMFSKKKTMNALELSNLTARKYSVYFHLLPVFILAVSRRYLRVTSCSFPFASYRLLSFSPVPGCLSTGSDGGFQHKKPRWWYKVARRCRKTAHDGLTATEAGKKGHL